jgi:hypothetical protein
MSQEKLKEMYFKEEDEEGGLNTPAGHSLHSLAPLAEELENVPRGHGSNVATLY